VKSSCSCNFMAEKDIDTETPRAPNQAGAVANYGGYSA